MDSLCIYPTVFTKQMSFFSFPFFVLYLLTCFFLFISVKSWSCLPCVHTLHVGHRSDSHIILFFFKVSVLVARLFLAINKRLDINTAVLPLQVY